MEEDMNQKLLREVDAAGEISVVDQVPLKDKVWSEMKKMWVVAVPAIFTRASTFGINVITQAFVGHIGSTELAAYSFIYTVFLSFAIGVAIGAGLQSIVAYVNLTAYYLVGIPVGAVLGFVFDMEVKGVWIGMLFGTFVQTVVLIIMTYKTNWDEQVIIARNRVNRWTVKDGNEPDHTT
ncbi:protein detoxification 20 [Quercus suber]|uniref:Protein detoxification 20 n=1 Tax=Quercus suber TaxID=58331 RepID=A0AAW0LMA3_QUESU